MKIIGLTGGIGSGKSTLAEWFREKGIPVYNSDDEAKGLMNNDETLKIKLISEFGELAFQDGVYNKTFISSVVFSNPEALRKLNEIVHPAVFNHFKNWLKKQKSKFVVKEAAILFESGSWKDCDAIISVIADEDIRIDRVIKRNHLTKEQIKNRIKNQWTDGQRAEKSDFVIKNNSGLDELRNEFEKVYEKLTAQYLN